MKIYLKNKPAKISKKLIVEACNFYADCLISKRLKNNLCVTIEYIPDFFRKTKAYADAGPEHEEDRLPRDFVIRVDANSSRIKILKDLAHEFVHIEQYASGRLKEYARMENRFRWEDQIIDADVEADEKAYYFSPWEIEAYGKEVGLYKIFMTRKKNK